MTVRTLAAIALAVILGAAAPARAGGDDPPNSDRKVAEQHFRIGEKAYKAQSFQAAAEHFDAAYQALPLPEIAFSAAQAYRRSYRVEPKLQYAQRAVELYNVYLAKVKHGGRVGDAADSLGEMEREVAKQLASGARTTAPVEPVQKTGLVIDPQLGVEAGSTFGEIADLPGGASDAKVTVLVDGKPAQPYQTVELAAGPHKVRVEAVGYQPREVTASVTDNRTNNVPVVLEPLPAKVALDVEAGARVRIDGRPVAGTAPLKPLEVAAGHHVITISRNGREPIAREIVVTRGQSLAIRESLQKTTRRKAVPWVLGVAGGIAVFATASVIAGEIYENRAQDQQAKIDAGDQPASAADEYERLRVQRGRFVTGAWVAGGAALLVTGLAATLYFGDNPSDENVRVTPLVGAPTATGSAATIGAALVGRF